MTDHNARQAGLTEKEVDGVLMDCGFIVGGYNLRQITGKLQAILAAHSADARNAKSAKQRYEEAMKPGEEPSAIERLRFFCSLAMYGQDWIDVEPFFDSVLAEARNAAISAGVPFVGLSVQLMKALKRLSFAAQTAGGVAGRDDDLVAAIAEAEEALNAAKGSVPAGNVATGNQPADARNGEGVALTDMRWRDVSVEKPTQAQQVLFVRNGKVHFGAWINDIFWYSNEKVCALYWMPLPEAPTLAAPATPAPLDVTAIPGYVTPAQASETAEAHVKIGTPMDPCDCAACVKMRGHLYGDMPAAPAPTVGFSAAVHQVRGALELCEPDKSHD